MPLSSNRLMTLVETRMSIVKISIIFKIDLERFISTSSDCGLKKNAFPFFASVGVKKKIHSLASVPIQYNFDSADHNTMDKIFVFEPIIWKSRSTGPLKLSNRELDLKVSSFG